MAAGHLRLAAEVPDGKQEAIGQRLDLLGRSLSVDYLAKANLRFDSYVLVSSLGCHIWTGATDRDSYGKFWLGERAVAAHRFAYERTKGVIPEGMQVDHICVRRSCVNPDHLQLATARQNFDLSQTRAGRSTTYRRSDAQNDGLVVDLADLPLIRSGESSPIGSSPWVPPMLRGGWTQAGEGWSEPRCNS